MNKEGKLKKVTHKGEKLEVDFYENFLEPEKAKLILDYIEEKIEWKKRMIYGKLYQVYGDFPSMLPWDDLPILKAVRNHVKTVTGLDYNYCFVQKYKDGNRGISPHRDNEVLEHLSISGVSLGATRIFTVSPPSYIKAEKINLTLNPGSLYVLKSPTNKHWLHSIEKDPNIKEPRISLTFRFAENEENSHK